jgi:hypothetical protein
MSPKDEERKKILTEYLEELFDKLDKCSKEYEEKREEARKITKERDNILSEIESVAKVYDRFVPADNQTNKKPVNALSLVTKFSIESIKEPISVVEALKIIFKESPTKEFSPVELRDKLESLKKKELLSTDAENLLWITHSAIRTLLRENFISKKESGTWPTYQRKIDARIDYQSLREILGIDDKDKKGNNE